MGTKKVLGYFKRITKNDKNIIGYVHGNYEKVTEQELETALQPHIQDWKKIKMKDICLRLERAADAGKLATGVREVWKQASLHKGQLLVVEKNFIYPAEHGGVQEVIENASFPFNKFSYIKDAVDDIIEKVLEYGGDVEFVDEGVLKDKQRIALIQYY
jgi:Bacterial archaeo-eukaryotic release factor family 3